MVTLDSSRLTAAQLNELGASRVTDESPSWASSKSHLFMAGQQAELPAALVPLTAVAVPRPDGSADGPNPLVVCPPSLSKEEIARLTKAAADMIEWNKIGRVKTLMEFMLKDDAKV